MAVSPQPTLYPTGNDAATSAAIALLIHYFNLAPASAQLLVKKWLTNYPAIWVRAAVTEALYQGRYKPFSVEQILAFWQRRGKSIAHFNKEFETIIAVPLQGSFKTETDVAIEGNSALAANFTASESGEPNVAEPAIAPSTTLAEALEAAEQEQADNDDPLPRPRLMLPGELPGRGLAQKETATPLKTTSEDSPSTSPSPTQIESSNSSLAAWQPGSLSNPTGFDGVIDPRPRPQITQGPDSALVAEAKSNQLQPPPIGPFTPAADPSGFASRLKTVVEQAIAKTQSEEEQLSLETAIASQLASDPVLGNPAPEEAAADGELQLEEESPLTVEPEPTTASSAEAALPTDEAEQPEVIEDLALPSETSELQASADQPATESLNDSEARLEEAIVQAVADSETSATATPSNLTPTETLSEKLPESLTTPQETNEVEASAPEQSEQDSAPGDQPTTPQLIFESPDQPEAVIATPASEEIDSISTEVHAAFEDRFPLTEANDNDSSTESPKDDIDIALDNRLQQTLDEEAPNNSLTPPDNDRLNLVFDADPGPQVELSQRDRLKDSIEADEAALYALGKGQLLDDEALSRHLDSELRDTGSDVTSSLDQAPREASEAAPIINASPETPGVETSNIVPPAQPSTTPLPAATLEISQVSNLMAGLTQLNLAKSDEASSTLSDIDTTAAETSNELDHQQATGGNENSSHPTSD